MRVFNVLIAMALMTGPCISQSSRNLDSSLIANKDLRKAAILIEQGKGCKEELLLQDKKSELLNNRIDLLLSRINIKDSIISACGTKTILLEGIIVNDKLIKTRYEETIALKDKMYATSSKRQKRKTFLALLIAVILGVGVVLK